MRGRGPVAWLFLSLGGLAVLILVLLAASVAWLSLDRAAEEGRQIRRVAALRGLHEPSPILAADLAFPDRIPFNRFRLLATHNSYRGRGSALGLFIIGLIKPAEPPKLHYAHPPLTEQLDAGIRSFELDLRARKGGFVLAHVPLVDARGPEPDFALALEELTLWSNRNPGHLPLVLLFELKDDYAFLDPALRPWDAGAFDRLDETLRRGLGAKLFSPEAIGTGPWPNVGDLRNRIIVILHENEDYRLIYEMGHPGLAGRVMFDCRPGGVLPSRFAVLNDPVKDLADIKRSLEAGIIVRTRADADLDIGSGTLEAALGSGANIVSTDFPPGHAGPSGYVAVLPGSRTWDSQGSVSKLGDSTIGSSP